MLSPALEAYEQRALLNFATLSGRLGSSSIFEMNSLNASSQYKEVSKGSSCELARIS